MQKRKLCHNKQFFLFLPRFKDLSTSTLVCISHFSQRVIKVATPRIIKSLTLENVVSVSPIFGFLRLYNPEVFNNSAQIFIDIYDQLVAQNEPLLYYLCDIAQYDAKLVLPILKSQHFRVSSFSKNVVNHTITNFLHF